MFVSGLGATALCRTEAHFFAGNVFSKRCRLLPLCNSIKPKSRTNSDSSKRQSNEQRRYQAASPRPPANLTARAPTKLSTSEDRSSKANPESNPSLERIAKVMAAAGVASRRACEGLIAAGKVKVNNKQIDTPATLVNPRKDRISVDGKDLKISTIPKMYYFAVNKPKGYICSNIDTKGGKRAVDLLQPWLDEWTTKNAEKGGLPPRLFTVGRLDVNTMGLIFITNDGDWAQRVIHPSADITKEYIASLEKNVTRAQLAAMAAGTLVEGSLVVPKSVEVVEGEGGRWPKVRIVVQEGKKHEVREIVAAAGCELHSLKRVRIGGFRMPHGLALGSYRSLSEAQLKLVTQSTGDRDT